MKNMRRANYKNAAEVGGCSGCGCLIALLLINLTFGAWAFDYVLNATTGKDVNWAVDMVGGLFLGEITVPAAVVCWILKLAGLDTPFFHV